MSDDGTVEKIIAYEQGDLGAWETLRLFGNLIASGLAWSLQGHYGRTASQFIEAGLIARTGEVDWARAEEVLND